MKKVYLFIVFATLSLLCSCKDRFILEAEPSPIESAKEACKLNGKGAQVLPAKLTGTNFGYEDHFILEAPGRKRVAIDLNIISY